MKRALLAVSLAVMACSGGDGTDGPNPQSLTCEQIQAALTERVAAVSHACVTVADCTAVGYATRGDGLPTCDCAPTFGGACSGEGVAAAAWAGDTRAQELLAEWEARCVPATCSSANICGCDCGRGNLTCSNGFCRVSDYDCFNPVDAAVD